MAEASFHRVGKSQKRMYGPRCILICGYRSDEQEQILSLFRTCGLSDCPVVFAADADADTSLGDLVTLESQKGKGLSSGLARAIIMSGFTEKELHALLSAYKKEKLAQQLWATLTPTSETWTLNALLEELAREAAAFRNKR
jgi:hypothetical protein